MSATIRMEYHADTDLSWVATRIEWLALAGKKIAIDEESPDMQALFAQIEDLAAPLYQRLLDMKAAA